MANPKIVNSIDYDLAAIRAGGAVPSVPGKVKLVHHFGFDAAASFQRIGVPTRKIFSVQDGGSAVTAMSFDIQPPGICKIVSQDMSLKMNATRQGVAVIESVAPGDCKLILLAGGTKVDSVSLKAVPVRFVITRFYNLIDAKGRRGVDPARPDVSLAALDSLIDQVNGIVGAQCDVWMAKSGQGLLRDLSCRDDLQNKIDINRFNIFAQSDMDGQAEYHVMFVWGIDGPHSNGITKSNVTMIDASITTEKREITLAHEFVHFLSGGGIVTVGDHDTQQDDLMFKTAPHGINMRKDRLAKIIPH